MNIGTSGLTGTIYAGKSKPTSDGTIRHWVGKKEDVTDEAVRAVFEHMYIKAEETGYYEVSLDGFGTMSFKRVSFPSGLGAEATGTAPRLRGVDF